MAKKIAAAVLAVVLVLSCFNIGMVASAADNKTGTYRVTASTGVKLYGDAKQSVAFITTASKDTCLTVLKIVSGFGYTTCNSLYGWVDLSSGVEYISEMPTITGNGTVEGAKSLKVKKTPAKTTYVEGEEEPDTDGLEVALVFDDANKTEMSVTGYTVAFPSVDTYGDKQVKIYYAGLTASYDISVVKVPVTSIVLQLPYKTTYVEGEAVSLDGLGVTAFFSDGRDSGLGQKLNPDEYILSGVTDGDTTLKPGNYTVTVQYKYPEIFSTFHIYVSEKKVKTLRLTKIPVDATLYQGQYFNIEDFALNATYDNGLSEDITDFDIEYDSMEVGTHTARIYYMGKYVAFDYTIKELSQTGIVIAGADRTGCYVGDEPDFSALHVFKVYNSGDSFETWDYTLEHNIDVNTVGEYPVKVVCGDYEENFNIKVVTRSTVMIGDVDLNNVVNAADARLALRCSAKLETLSDNARLAADVNGDDKVDASDARKILRVAAKLDKF